LTPSGIIPYPLPAIRAAGRNPWLARVKLEKVFGAKEALALRMEGHDLRIELSNDGIGVSV
jgi:hypothetical protein